MNRTELQNAIKRLLRAEVQRERASDFAMLRRIPSTDIRKFLHHYSGLDGASKDALAEAMVESALVYFFPCEIEHPYKTRNVAWCRYAAAHSMIEGWDFTPVRVLRSLLSLSKSSPTFGMPDDVQKRIENIKPVKSTEIRKLVKIAFTQIMPPIEISHMDSIWRYEGTVEGRSLCVEIDYYQKNAQFAYWIPLQRSTPEKPLIAQFGLSPTYERLIGLDANWDCLEEANLDQSIALLKELILQCSRFLQLLPASYEQRTNL